MKNLSVHERIGQIENDMVALKAEIASMATTMQALPPDIVIKIAGIEAALAGMQADIGSDPIPAGKVQVVDAPLPPEPLPGVDEKAPGPPDIIPADPVPGEGKDGAP